MTGGPSAASAHVCRTPPPSEANTTVAVIDARSGDKAVEVQGVLGDAGFDISPGIRGPEEKPDDVRGGAILFRPGDEAYAKVVGAYFPSLPLIESAAIRGTRVAIVVSASSDSAPPDQGSGGSKPECPPSAG